MIIKKPLLLHSQIRSVLQRRRGIEINLEIDYRFLKKFKKNFQKHLVNLEKVFTFALANRLKDDKKQYADLCEKNEVH